jgi:hypothetical protein
MRFYLLKIGKQLQKLAVLAILIVSLDRDLTIHRIIVWWAVCGTILLLSIEMERRAR